MKKNCIIIFFNIHFFLGDQWLAWAVTDTPNLPEAAVITMVIYGEKGQSSDVPIRYGLTDKIQPDQEEGCTVCALNGLHDMNFGHILNHSTPQVRYL